jgi:DMSO/TMAO reductase YedYZ molybdopterin-dependent catalytic subunit
MRDSIDRRRFLEIATVAGLSPSIGGGPARVEASPGDQPRACKAFLTDARDFVDVSRGKPKPFKLKGEALEKARLTPQSWRMEIVGDRTSTVPHPHRLEDRTALDLDTLKEMGRTHGVKYLKAMQCNNIPVPLGQGLWEGVPLRELIRRVGKLGNVRRVYYWGFHNNDPAQIFQSSLSYNRAMETPPWEPPPLVAYRLNGEDIPLERGGPVRMVVPWAHGFKSIKWLQRIVLTNNYQANDTYALQNNDPESYLKTAAYLGSGSRSFKAGAPIAIEGTVMVGWSGLKRVECWVRPSSAWGETLGEDDPAWKSAVWSPCDLMPPPSDWKLVLPVGTKPRDVWGFDAKTGKPKDWPLLFSMVPWTVQLDALKPGGYEVRARAVDLNGFAQPEPRPYQKAGMNVVGYQRLVVSA